MIAIIGALKEEIDGLRILLTDTKKDKRFQDITSGHLHGREVVLCVCGVGKVYSAAAAAYILSNYNVSEIINIGVAGGVGSEVKKLDIVVADKTVQCDFDLTPCGLKKGQLFEGHNTFFESSEGIVTRLYNLAKTAFSVQSDQSENKKEIIAHKGVIATGDKFVASAEDGLHLRRTFGALACDMESAAIAQVAEMYKVGFASMRSISDNADDGAPGDFDAFVKCAAEISIGILSEYLRQ